MKLPAQPIQYDQSLEQQRSGIIERAVNALEVAGPFGPTPAEISLGVNVNKYYPPGNPKRYGAVADGATDDTAAWETALAVASASPQGKVRFSGTHKITGTIQIPLGVSIEGDGPTYGSVILLSGASASITMNGSDHVGGWSFRHYFRDLTVRHAPGTSAPTSGKLVEINSAYNIEFDNVFIVDVPSSSTGIHTTDVNDVALRNIVIRGEASATNNYAIQATGSSTVQIFNCDIEVVKYGVYVAGTSFVDIVAPYMERVVVGVQNDAGTSGRVSIFGGYIYVANDSCWPVSSYGIHTYVHGTKLGNTLGTQKHYVGASFNTMFYDAENKRLQLGQSAAAGEISPANLLTLNPKGTAGSAYGWSLGSSAGDLTGEYQSHIGGVSTFSGDWNFMWTGSGEKTARFFGNGAAQLNLYSDGNIVAGLGYYVGGDSGPRIFSGTGAPTSSAPDGSLFLRTDGTGPNLYVRENGAWVSK